MLLTLKPKQSQNTLLYQPRGVLPLYPVSNCLNMTKILHSHPCIYHFRPKHDLIILPYQFTFITMCILRLLIKMSNSPNRSSSPPPWTLLHIHLVYLDINCQLNQIQLGSTAQIVFSQPWLDSRYSLLVRLYTYWLFYNYNDVKAVFGCYNPEFLTQLNNYTYNN